MKSLNENILSAWKLFFESGPDAETREFIEQLKKKYPRKQTLTFSDDDLDYVIKEYVSERNGRNHYVDSDDYLDYGDYEDQNETYDEVNFRKYIDEYLKTSDDKGLNEFNDIFKKYLLEYKKEDFFLSIPGYEEWYDKVLNDYFIFEFDKPFDIRNFWVSGAFKMSIPLGVFEKLLDGKISADEIISKYGKNKDVINTIQFLKTTGHELKDFEPGSNKQNDELVKQFDYIIFDKNSSYCSVVIDGLYMNVGDLYSLSHNKSAKTVSISKTNKFYLSGTEVYEVQSQTSWALDTKEEKHSSKDLQLKNDLKIKLEYYDFGFYPVCYSKRNVLKSFNHVSENEKLKIS